MYDVPITDIPNEIFIKFIECVNKNNDIEKYVDVFIANGTIKRLLEKIRVYKDQFSGEEGAYSLAIIIVKKDIWDRKDYFKVATVLIDLLDIIQDKSHFMCDIIREVSLLPFADYVYRRIKNDQAIIKEIDVHQISASMYEKIQTEVDAIGAEFITKYSYDFTLLMSYLQEMGYGKYVEETIRKWLTSYQIIEKFLWVFSYDQQFDRSSYVNLSQLFPIEEMHELVKKLCFEDNNIVKEFLNEYKKDKDVYKN